MHGHNLKRHDLAKMAVENPKLIMQAQCKRCDNQKVHRDNLKVRCDNRQSTSAESIDYKRMIMSFLFNLYVPSTLRTAG